MSGTALQFNSNACNPLGAFQPIRTSSLFDCNHTEPSCSAIDRFIHKTLDLNILQGRLGGSSIDPTSCNLLLLGYVSAVESYFRELIRRLVLIDDLSRKNSLRLNVTYGAATTYAGDHLPEALLDGRSLANPFNIRCVIKDVLGLKGGKLSNAAETSLTNFGTVCQMRHCIVHRYGRLGADNAIKLDLDAHAPSLEKPLNLDFNSLQAVINSCQAVVRDMNNFLFRRILCRTVEENSVQWTWDMRRDKANFKKYYDLFAATHFSATTGANMQTAYNAFRTAAKAHLGVS